MRRRGSEGGGVAGSAGERASERGPSVGSAGERFVGARADGRLGGRAPAGMVFLGYTGRTQVQTTEKRQTLIVASPNPITPTATSGTTSLPSSGGIV